MVGAWFVDFLEMLGFLLEDNNNASENIGFAEFNGKLMELLSLTGNYSIEACI